MKTPHLATALLAGIASIGGLPTTGRNASVSIRPHDMNIDFAIRPSRLRVEQIEWNRRNQRQRRKDRRRAHAAGKRRAFH